MKQYILIPAILFAIQNSGDADAMQAALKALPGAPTLNGFEFELGDDSINVPTPTGTVNVKVNDAYIKYDGANFSVQDAADFNSQYVGYTPPSNETHTAE